MATRSPVRTLPLALASLAEVLALAGVLVAVIPIGQTGIIENDGWGALPVLFIPAVTGLDRDRRPRQPLDGRGGPKEASLETPSYT